VVLGVLLGEEVTLGEGFVFAIVPSRSELIVFASLLVSGVFAISNILLAGLMLPEASKIGETNPD
jgi:hypothetical protein